MRASDLRRPLRVRGWLAIVGALVVLVACEGGRSAGDAEGSTTVPARQAPLLVVDVAELTAEEQLSFAALQGIVNREAPRLYLVGLRDAQDFEIDPSAEAWLDDVVDLPTRRVSPSDALAELGDEVGGLVVWDPDVPAESQNVATMLAGTEDLLPVGPDQLPGLSDTGLKVVRDLRELGLSTPREFTEWSLDELPAPEGGWALPVWTGRPRNGRAIQPGLRDWAVAERAFVFDLDPASEPALLRRILDGFPKGTPVYGYPFFDTEVYAATGVPVNEGIAVAQISEAGHWLFPTTDAANLTVHSRLGAEIHEPRWDDSARTPDAATTYVSFVISDGDALGYDLTLARHLQVDKMDDSTIPMGLSTSPQLATVAPRIWNWFVDRLPKNVRLVTGPSGNGYVLPMSLTDADRDRFLDQSRAAARRAGLRSTWLLNPPLTPPPPSSTAAAFAKRLGSTLVYAGYSPGAPSSPVVAFADGVPYVQAVAASKPDDIVPAVRAAVALQPGLGPKFVAVGLITWGTTAADAATAMGELGPGFVAVAPDEFAGLLRGAASNGYRGSPDRGPSSQPSAGACRADLSRARLSGATFTAGVLANALLPNDLPGAFSVTRDATSVAAVVPTGPAAALVATSFASVAPLAFGPSVVDGASVTVTVDRVTADIGGDRVPLEGSGRSTQQVGAAPGAAAASYRTTSAPAGGDLTAIDGELRIEVAYDPGDSTVTAVADAPIRCRPAG